MNFGGNAAFEQADMRAEQEREAGIAAASLSLRSVGTIQCEDCPNDIPASAVSPFRPPPGASGARPNTNRNKGTGDGHGKHSFLARIGVACDFGRSDHLAMAHLRREEDRQRSGRVSTAGCRGKKAMMAAITALGQRTQTLESEPEAPPERKRRHGDAPADIRHGRKHRPDGGKPEGRGTHYQPRRGLFNRERQCGSMNDYNQHLTVDARLVILRALNDQPDGRLNESILSTILETFAHRRSREWIRQQAPLPRGHWRSPQH